MRELETCDLRLIPSLNEVGGIPKVGKNLLIVAEVDHVLYFRIFDADGRLAQNIDEKWLPGQFRQIEKLRKELASLWPPHKLTAHEKVRVIAAVRSILGDTPLQKLARFVRKSPREQFARVQRQLVNWGWYVPHLGNDRTAYVLGLYGNGRLYINSIIQENIGERAKYFIDEVRLHRGPTSMIYSGHATMRHASHGSLGQYPPAVTSRVLEAARSGFADVIFPYRHPLDSLLTNWTWFRQFRFGTGGAKALLVGVSESYKNTDDLCVELERSFCEFQAFAEGDPGFFAAVGWPPFLSFPEYVEETELFLESATLALRFEDFMTDPLKEFSKIAEVMSVDLNLSHLRVVPPRTKPFRYLAAKENVSRFRNFVNGLDGDTRRRIEKIGYGV
jgi:hypothetical protein